MTSPPLGENRPSPIVARLNLNQLRIFAAVYRLRSMTKAATELHLTQSGVSQHVKALEDALAVPLFDRLPQKLVPTQEAHRLYEGCTRGLAELERALWEVSTRELEGTVTIGSPPEFAYNVLLPLLAAFVGENPRVSFRLVIGLAPTMVERSLEGEVDFAFIDEFPIPGRLSSQRVYGETIELCASPQLVKRLGPTEHTAAYYDKLPLVSYLDDGDMLRRWFRHHLGTKRADLRIKASLADCQSVARAIFAGIGAGVLPDHLLDRLTPGQKVHRFSGTEKPLINAISLVRLEERALSAATASLQKHLLESITRLDPSRRSPGRTK